MPRPLPPDAIASLSPAEAAKASTWWQTLSDSARREFELLWDERNDDTSLYATTGGDGALTWHQLPITVRGLIVEGRRPDHSFDEDLYDFLVNHPEGVVLLAGRTFHICRAHPAARDVLRAGFLPCDFRCPFDDANCPMKALLAAAGGKNVALQRSPLTPVPARRSPPPPASARG